MSLRKFDYSCMKKYALTGKNERLFIDIQPCCQLQKSLGSCKICRG